MEGLAPLVNETSKRALVRTIANKPFIIFQFNVVGLDFNRREARSAMGVSVACGRDSSAKTGAPTCNSRQSA
jgi:hypothetical protein